MDRKIILGLFLLAILLGCLEKVPEVSELETETTTTQEIIFPSEKFEIFLSLDKELYHSNELMNISVKVLNSEEVEDARVRVYGIYSGRNKLNKTRIVDLEAGENLFYFPYRTPRCFGCAGISPGIYSITAEVEYKGRVRANVTKSIEIRE